MSASRGATAGARTPDRGPAAATVDARALEQRLSARDPRLRALPLVLDDRRLLRALARRWPEAGRAPRHVEVTYLRYKPDTHLLAGLTLTFADGHRELAALYGAGEDDDPKLRKARERAIEVGHRWPFVESTRRRWIVTPARADRNLEAAPDLARLARRAHPPLGRVTVVPLAYKPQRRLVARLDRRGRPVATVKLHRATAFDDVARVADWVERHADDHDLRLPRTLGADGDRGLHVTAWVPGTPFDHLDARGDDHLAGIGRQLARLHNAPVDGLPRRDDDDAHLLRPLRLLHPEAAERAEPAAAAVTRWLGQAATHVVHGDLSADQVVIGDDEPTLIDLDRTHTGRPVEDLASWVAGGALRRGSFDDLAVPPALLDAYHAAGGPATTDDLDVATAAALLRRVSEPFRLRDDGWPERTLALVDAAVRLTRGARP